MKYFEACSWNLWRGQGGVNFLLINKDDPIFRGYIILRDQPEFLVYFSIYFKFYGKLTKLGMFAFQSE